MSPVEALAVIVTIAGIVLTAQRRVLGWPCSLAASALYLAVFAKARLYADSALQIVFCLFLLKGWYDWYRAAQDEAGITVRPIARTILIRDLALGVATSLVLGVALRDWTSDAAPMTDATLSVFSVVGQIWTARRLIACWPLWIAVDCAYIALFLERTLWLSAGLYAGLTGLAVWGWLTWRKAQISHA